MGAERRTRWTDDHGDKPLGTKFHVYCAGDRHEGTLIDPSSEYFDSKRLGATGEFVFVLRPESDAAAWLALREYMHDVAWRDPELSAALREQLDRIERAQP